jgi:hypothetical protein
LTAAVAETQFFPKSDDDEEIEQEIEDLPVG